MKNGITAIIVFFCLFTACEADDNVHVKFDQKTYNEQKQFWQASNTKDYEYRLLARGFIMYDGKIVVENGSFKEEEIYQGEADSSIGLLYSTIDEIYERIEGAFEFSKGKNESDFYYSEISVEYDTINHIPIKINYITHIPPGLAVDGVFDYTISNFKKK